MPDATPHLDHTPHSDLPPPGRRSSEPVERFAEVLDGLVLGSSVPETDGANDPSLTRLTATARRIQRRHGSRITASGLQSTTPIEQARKQQIWEGLMAHHAPTPSPATAPTAQPPTIGRLGALMQPWITIDDERPARHQRASTGPFRFISDPQPAITFTMVIAVLIAIGAAFSTLADPGNPGVTPTASAEGIAGLAGPGSPAAAPAATPPTAPAAAPTAVPTADPSDEFQRPIPAGDGACPVEPRPIEEIAAFLRDPGPVTPRAYLPATAPEPSVAEEVARFGRTYLPCEYAESVNVDRALQTPRFIYEDRTNAYFREAGGARDKATSEEREQLATLVLGEDPQTSQFIVTELAISREEYEAAVASGAPPDAASATPTDFLPEQIDQTFRPEQAVRLADGRIAIPETYLVDPSDLDALLSADPDDAYPYIVWFSIFARDATRDGQWGLDERLGVCLGNGLWCDDFYEDVDPTGDALFPAPATPSPSPEVTSPPATPAPRATPAAWDNFLSPIVAGECAVTTPRSSTEVAAILQDPGELSERAYLPASPVDFDTASSVIRAGRSWLACGMFGQPGETRALESTRFIFEDPANAFFGRTSAQVKAENLPLLQEMSTTLLDPSGMAYLAIMDMTGVVEPTPVPGDIQDLWWLDQTMLRGQLVQLADGRIGGPIITLVPTGRPLELYDTPYTEVRFVIFTRDSAGGGQWLVDEVLPLCVGDCDPVWAAIAADEKGPIVPPQPTSATPDEAAGAYDARLIVPVPGPGTPASNPAA